MEIIRLRTNNDKNGNPRRLFMRIEDGAITGILDEGYYGEAIVKDQWGVSFNGPTIDITPSEYRRYAD